MTKSFEILKALVWEAYQRVKASGGASGADQESIERFERRLGDNLYVVWNRLCSGSYFPPPVRRANRRSVPYVQSGAAWLGELLRVIPRLRHGRRLEALGCVSGAVAAVQVQVPCSP